MTDRTPDTRPGAETAEGREEAAFERIRGSIDVEAANRARLLGTGLAWFDDRTDRWVMAIEDVAALTDLGYSVVPKGEVERLREALQVAEGTLNRMTVVDQRASVGIFIAAINQTLDEVSSALRGGPDATD